MKKISVILLVACIALFAVSAFADDPPINTGTGLRVGQPSSVRAPQAPMPTLSERFQAVYERVAARVRHFVNVSEIKKAPSARLAMSGVKHAGNVDRFGFRS